jgi:hypothetical protein
VELIKSIILDTPIWVWGILAYILYVGIQAFKERIVSIPKLLIMPMVLIAVRYKVFLSDNTAVLSWLSICSGAGLGIWITAKNAGAILKEINSVKLQGSYATLVLLLSFFMLKYAFGYLSSTHNVIAVEYAFIETLLSSLMTGYFLGRGFYYMYRLR